MQACEHIAKQSIHGHLRTPSEGLQPECTKPGRKKNKMNTGASVNVCAGITNSKVALWEHLPQKWNGENAANLYKGAIYRTLKRQRGTKRKYIVLEDNDPSGYKSGKAKTAKREPKIDAIPFPAYSPDRNPLDYSIWSEINRRMLRSAPAKVESVTAYKARLRQTALRLPKAFVRNILECAKCGET